MERVYVAHSVTRAPKNLAGTIFGSGSHDTEHKLQSISRTIVKSSPDTGSEIDQVLAEPRVLTKSGVWTIVESGLNKCKSPLKL